MPVGVRPRARRACGVPQAGRDVALRGTRVRRAPAAPRDRLRPARRHCRRRRCSRCRRRPRRSRASRSSPTSTEMRAGRSSSPTASRSPSRRASTRTAASASSCARAASARSRASCRLRRARPAALALGVVVKSADGSPTVLAGSRDASRLEVRSASVRGGVRAASASGLDSFVEIALQGARIVVKPDSGDADGFLASLLPGDGLTVDLALPSACRAGRASTSAGRAASRSSCRRTSSSARSRSTPRRSPCGRRTV